MEIDSALGGGAGPHAELLEELSTLTLEQIRRRRAQLRVTHAGLQVQLVELASGSCAAFVESAACACEVNERLRRIGGHLKMLEGSLPRVGTEACALARTGADREARRNARLLERHAEVLEALEQPQMMDMRAQQCRRSSTSRRRGPRCRTRRCLWCSRCRRSESMGARAALLAQLAPAAPARRAALRRLSETDGGRSPERRSCVSPSFGTALPLRACGSARFVPSRVPAQVDGACRTHWYDTLTLYRTYRCRRIAAARPQGSRSATAPPSFRLGLAGRRRGGGNAVALVDLGAAYILACLRASPTTTLPTLTTSSWRRPHGEAALAVRRRRWRAARNSARRLPAFCARTRAVSATLECVARHPRRRPPGPPEQAASCGASLVRLGLDRCAVRLFRAAVRASSTMALPLRCSTGTRRSPPTDGTRSSLPLLLSRRPQSPPQTSPPPRTPPRRGCGGGGGWRRRGAALTPPTALLAHPPVGTLCNHLLMVLNELRQCAAYGLRPLLFDRLSVALVAAVAALRELPARAAFTDGAHEQFRALCMCFADNLVPHVGGCADILIPPWVSPTFPAPESNDCRTDRLIATVRAEVEPLLRQEEAP